jgi:hypothetical protein
VLLVIKIALFHKTTEEICEQMNAKLEIDTNTLITISSGDRYIKRLAAELNTQ